MYTILNKMLLLSRASSITIRQLWTLVILSLNFIILYSYGWNTKVHNVYLFTNSKKQNSVCIKKKLSMLILKLNLFFHLLWKKIRRRFNALRNCSHIMLLGKKFKKRKEIPEGINNDKSCTQDGNLEDNCGADLHEQPVDKNNVQPFNCKESGISDYADDIPSHMESPYELSDNDEADHSNGESMGNEDIDVKVKNTVMQNSLKMLGISKSLVENIVRHLESKGDRRFIESYVESYLNYSCKLAISNAILWLTLGPKADGNKIKRIMLDLGLSKFMTLRIQHMANKELQSHSLIILLSDITEFFRACYDGIIIILNQFYEDTS